MLWHLTAASPFQMIFCSISANTQIISWFGVWGSFHWTHRALLPPTVAGTLMWPHEHHPPGKGLWVCSAKEVNNYSTNRLLSIEVGSGSSFLLPQLFWLQRTRSSKGRVTAQSETHILCHLLVLPSLSSISSFRWQDPGSRHYLLTEG